MTTPTGRLIQYTRDADGRITQITTTPPGGQAQIVVSQVTYQPFGGVKSFTYGNGQTYTRSLDQDGRVTAYSQGTATQALNYDPASRITALTDAANPANPANPAANTASYAYDSLDRLTSAGLANANYGYSYDATGNRTVQTVGATSIPYSISPASNRIQSIGGSPPRTLSHDPNGALTNDGNAQYAYDAAGLQPAPPGAQTWSMPGERVKRAPPPPSASTTTTDKAG